MVLEKSNVDENINFIPFVLKDYHLSKEGADLDAEKYRDNRPILVAFICNHCPYIKHIIEPFSTLMNEVRNQVACIAISSNDISQYPEDDPENMYLLANQYKFSFPYCFDVTQEIAKKYKAVCTPDLFLFDSSKKIFYKGRFDATTPKSGGKATGSELKQAIDDLIHHRELSIVSCPSMGCSIKWRNK